MRPPEDDGGFMTAMKITQPLRPALTPSQAAELAGLTLHDAALIAAAMDAELADSTRIQYASAWRQWERWCRTAFADRVLPFDLPAARVLASYRVPEHAPLDDALIAAIAQSADMTVATRNTRHFEPLGVACLDPWAFDM